jgi:hypothetical protein
MDSMQVTTSYEIHNTTFFEFVWNEFLDILFGKGKIQSMVQHLLYE